MTGFSDRREPEGSVPLVSVIVPTYQHAPFIRECLDSIIGQRTGFLMEVLIGEDGSADGTREICNEYARRYPDLIRIFERDRKDVIHILGRPTGRSNVLALFAQARGKYIAVCEGDDHWVDPLKLRKQVAFLEENPGHVLCATRAWLLRGQERQEHAIPEGLDLFNITAYDLLRTYNFFATASVLYRRSAIAIHAHHRQVPFLDLAMYLTVAQQGKMAMLPDFTTVYRISPQGLWSGLSKEQQRRSIIRFGSIMVRHLPKDQAAVLKRKRMDLLREIARERFPLSPRRQRLYLQYLRLVLH